MYLLTILILSSSLVKECIGLKCLRCSTDEKTFDCLSFPWRQHFQCPKNDQCVVAQGVDPKDGSVIVQRDCASNYLTSEKYMKRARNLLRTYLHQGHGYNCVQQDHLTRGTLTVCTCTSDMCNYQDIHSLMEFSRNDLNDAVCKTTRCEKPNSYVCLPSERVEFGPKQCHCLLSPSCSELPRYGHILESQQMVKPVESRVVYRSLSVAAQSNLANSASQDVVATSSLTHKIIVLTSSTQPIKSQDGVLAVNASKSVPPTLMQTASMSSTMDMGQNHGPLGPSSYSPAATRSVESSIEPSSVISSITRSQSARRTAPLPVTDSVTGFGDILGTVSSFVPFVESPPSTPLAADFSNVKQESPPLAYPSSSGRAGSQTFGRDVSPGRTSYVSPQQSTRGKTPTSDVQTKIHTSPSFFSNLYAQSSKGKLVTIAMSASAPSVSDAIGSKKLTLSPTPSLRPSQRTSIGTLPVLSASSETAPGRTVIAPNSLGPETTNSVDVDLESGKDVSSVDTESASSFFKLLPRVTVTSSVFPEVASTQVLVVFQASKNLSTLVTPVSSTFLDQSQVANTQIRLVTKIVPDLPISPSVSLKVETQFLATQNGLRLSTVTNAAKSSSYPLFQDRVAIESANLPQALSSGLAQFSEPISLFASKFVTPVSSRVNIMLHPTQVRPNLSHSLNVAQSSFHLLPQDRVANETQLPHSPPFFEPSSLSASTFFTPVLSTDNIQLQSTWVVPIFSTVSNAAKSSSLKLPRYQAASETKLVSPFFSATELPQPTTQLKSSSMNLSLQSKATLSSSVPQMLLKREPLSAIPSVIEPYSAIAPAWLASRFSIMPIDMKSHSTAIPADFEPHSAISALIKPTSALLPVQILSHSSVKALKLNLKTAGYSLLPSSEEVSIGLTPHLSTETSVFSTTSVPEPSLFASSVLLSKSKTSHSASENWAPAKSIAPVETVGLNATNVDATSSKAIKLIVRPTLIQKQVLNSSLGSTSTTTTATTTTTTATTATIAATTTKNPPTTTTTEGKKPFRFVYQRYHRNGRCGIVGRNVYICDPQKNSPCCSLWGYCGRVAHCQSGVNLADGGVEGIEKWLQQLILKRTGEKHEIPKGFFPFEVSPYDSASDIFSMGLADGDLESKPICNFKPTSTVWARMPPNPKKTAKKCGYFDGRQHPCHPMGESPCCSRDGECGAEEKHCYGPGTVDYRRPVKCLRWDKMSTEYSESAFNSTFNGTTSESFTTPSSYHPVPSLIDCPPTSHCITYIDPVNTGLIRYGCAVHFFGFIDGSRYGKEATCCQFDGFSTVVDGARQSRTAPVCLCQGDLCNNNFIHFKPEPVRPVDDDLFCYFNHPVDAGKNVIHVVGCMGEGDRCVTLQNLMGDLIYSCLSHLKPTYHKLLARSSVPSGCLTIEFHDKGIPVCVCDTAECNSPVSIVPDNWELDMFIDRDYTVKRNFQYLYKTTNLT